LVRRLLQMIPLLLGISLIMFSLIQSAPGGPEAVFFESGRFINPQIVETYRHRLGLDQPLPIQYLKWLGAALTGDFSYSFSAVRPVRDMIVERLPATLELMLTAFVFAALIAIPLGIFSAVRQYSLLDFIGTGFSFLGIAMPVFWFGLILQLIFSVKLGWLPTAGRETVGQATLLDQVKHLILPGLVLSLLYIAGWSRYMRSSLLSVIRKEYILTARARGLRERSRG
jgi:peptide/nickel transport system permease protein